MLTKDKYTDANRVSAYTAWVKRLRKGRAVPTLAVESNGSLARLGRELQLLADALSQREHEFQHLMDVVETVEQGLSVEDVLNRIFDGFDGLIPYERIGCAFLSEDASLLTAYWARSRLGPIQICADYSQPMADSSLERILHTGKPRIINDLEEYSKAKPGSDSAKRIVLEGGRSNLTCPLIVGKRPIGFLFFTSLHKDAYREAHQAIFSQIARQVSAVIDKGRVYQLIVERNRQLVSESAKLEQAATHDVLTKTLNRAAIMNALDQALSGRVKTGKAIGVIMVDIDHFKAINDTMGHPVGDAALVEVASRLSGALRQGDLLGRYGGEEFLILVKDATRETLRSTAERLRQVLVTLPFRLSGEVKTITASFGAAVSDGVNDTAQDVIIAADRALYSAKSSGRNCVGLAYSISRPHFSA